MSLPILTLDTNIIVSALRSSLGASHRLVELVGQSRFDVGITTPLALEYESVGKRLIGFASLTSADIDKLVDYFCRVGKRSIVYFRTRPMLSDPKDELVLEAAFASGSSWLVTHNLRDFAAGAVKYGIEAITPAEALKRLGESR